MLGGLYFRVRRGKLLLSEKDTGLISNAWARPMRYLSLSQILLWEQSKSLRREFEPLEKRKSPLEKQGKESFQGNSRADLRFIV
jgi:hypothetical protein